MRRIFLLISIVASMNSFAQQDQMPLTAETIIPGNNLFATPDVTAFQRINFLPVNLYVGKVNVSIPIFEIKTGNISVPISITYNASGVKMDEEATNVGLGWNLNAGGSIIRIIKDIDDNLLIWDWEWVRGSIYEDYVPAIKHVIKKGFYRKYTDLLEEYNSDATSTSGEYAQEDSSPDLFIVNAPSLSSRFSFEKDDQNRYIANILDGTGISVAPSLISHYNFDNENPYGDRFINAMGFTSADILYGRGYTSLDVTMKYNARRSLLDYPSFNVQNINGVKYEFNQPDIVESIPVYPGVPNMLYPETWSNVNRYFINNYNINHSAWHLAKIEDPAFNKVVRFSYISDVDSTIKNKKMHVIGCNHNLNSLLPIAKNCDCPYYTGYGGIYEEQNIKEMDVQEIYYKNTLSHKINRIEWEGGSVDFIYTLPRQDTYNGNALTEIIVKNYSGNIIKHFKMHYSYFQSKENCADAKCKRLRLDKIEDLTDISNSLFYVFNYEYSSPLPKLYSLEQDYLGFYNNNGAKYTLDKSGYFRPTRPSMYFSPEKMEYSILPFSLDGSYVKISDGHSLESNSYSLQGVLNKVTYPTGGSVEFEYENHKYILLGKEVIAGGTRIKKQIISDGNGNKETFEYKYVDQAGKSSGRIANLPQFGNINEVRHKDQHAIFDPVEGSIDVAEDYFIRFLIYNRSRNEVELTNGSFVGYSRVIEQQIGNGYKEYIYTTSQEYPNEKVVSNDNDICSQIAYKNSLFPGVTYIDNDIRRGKLLRETFYNNNGGIIKNTIYNYSYKLFNSKEYEFNYLVGRGSLIPDYNYSSIKYKFKTKINSERNLLAEIHTTEFNNGNLLNIKTGYSYDQEYPLTKEITRSNSSTKIYKSKIYYPFDLVSDERLGSSSSLLLNEYRINEILKKEEYCNSTLLSQKFSVYKKNELTNNTTLPVTIVERLGNNSSGKEIQINQYDKDANPLQYTAEDGVATVYLWSYCGQYPIAEIKNATFSEVEAAAKMVFSVASADALSTLLTPNETKLKDGSLQKALPNAFVTTYTYKPLVGVLSTTAPLGITTYYEYDTSNRLRRTYIIEKDTYNLDTQKNIKTYYYHNKNQ